jgi:hypothetical protein
MIKLCALHRLIRCAVAEPCVQFTAASPLHATLLVMVQKLLGSITAGASPTVFSTVFTSGGAEALAHNASAAFHALQRARLMRRLPPSLPLQAYSGATLGVMLAGRLLLADGGTAQAVQDRQAVLGFVCRQPAFNDVAAVYALDALYFATACTRATSGAVSSSSSDSALSDVDDAALLQLTRITEKIIQAFGLNARYQINLHGFTLWCLTEYIGFACRHGSDSDFELCDVSLQLAPRDDDEVAPTGTPSFWQVAGLCAKLVDSSSNQGSQPASLTATRVRHACTEMAEACDALFYLCQRVAQVKALLTSHLEQTARLSFPRGQPSAETAWDSRRSGKRGARAVDGENRVPQLDADQSQQLLFTWSSAAADAFVGDFVLPASLTVEQALT